MVVNLRVGSRAGDDLLDQDPSADVREVRVTELQLGSQAEAQRGQEGDHRKYMNITHLNGMKSF